MNIHDILLTEENKTGNVSKKLMTFQRACRLRYEDLNDGDDFVQ